MTDQISLSSAVLRRSEREVFHVFGTRASTIGPTVSRCGGAIQTGTAGFPLVASVKQVHGTAGLVLDHPVQSGQALPGEWDAILTNQPGVLITVRTADCVPVLMYDARRKVAAAVHAGWRGAVGGIIERTITLLYQRFATEPGALMLGVGPAIGPCCYEVDEWLVERVRGQVPAWESLVRRNPGAKPRLDLPGLVWHQAVAAGVRPDNIDDIAMCTACRPELFYSYRRDGNVVGTMVSGIMLQANLPHEAGGEGDRAEAQGDGA